MPRKKEPACALDRDVQHALADLRRLRVPTPSALFLLGTGAGFLPSRLSGGGGLPLSAIEGVPEPWRPAYLHHGELNGLPVWILEDRRGPGPPAAGGQAGAAWYPGFPCWLAAAAGAELSIHTAAGSALTPAAGVESEALEPLGVGTLALVSDHLNLSGGTPLVGLAESELGPMFPDLTDLHDRRLRELAVDCAERLGVPVASAVAACTVGPSLDTPAERRFYARAGAAVAAQGLAPPLLAAAHAGLSALAIVVVTDGGDGPVDLARVLGASESAAPALEDLLWQLASELGALVAEES